MHTVASGDPPGQAPLLPPTPDTLTQKDCIFQAAEYLLGSRYGWQSELARRMGVDPRTVRRWLSCQERPTQTAWNLLLLMIRFKAVTDLDP